LQYQKCQQKRENIFLHCRRRQSRQFLPCLHLKMLLHRRHQRR
jgi:hypothetical protein